MHGLVLLRVAMVLVGSTGEAGAPIELSTNEQWSTLLAKATAEHQVLYVDVGSEAHCHPCRLIGPVFKELAGEFPNALFAKLDLFSEFFENEALNRELGFSEFFESIPWVAAYRPWTSRGAMPEQLNRGGGLPSGDPVKGLKDFVHEEEQHADALRSELAHAKTVAEPVVEPITRSSSTAPSSTKSEPGVAVKVTVVVGSSANQSISSAHQSMLQEDHAASPVRGSRDGPVTPVAGLDQLDASSPHMVSLDSHRVEARRVIGEPEGAMNVDHRVLGGSSALGSDDH